MPASLTSSSGRLPSTFVLTCIDFVFLRLKYKVFIFLLEVPSQILVKLLVLVHHKVMKAVLLLLPLLHKVAARKNGVAEFVFLD